MPLVIAPTRTHAPILTLALACGPSLPMSDTTASSSTSPSSSSTEPESTGTSTTGTSGDDPTSASGSTSGGAPGCAYERLPVVGLTGRSFVAAHFDQDDALDLAALQEGEALQLYLGDGSGLAFSPGPLHLLGAAGKMAGGDFDGDDRPDLIHYDLSFTPEIRVQLNVGGDFGPPIATPVDALFYTFRVADFDGDGDDDVSYGGAHSDPVHVRRSDAGVLSEAHQLAVQACYATGSDWADLDGDGDLDFAVIGDCNAVVGMPPIAVYLREGEGYTQILDAGQADGHDPPVLEAGDFDGDGVVDVVTQSYANSWAFERHLGLGDGTFGPRQAFPVPEGTWVRRALDGDGDGRVDLLVSGPETASETLLFRSTGEGFEPCVVGPGAFVEAGDFDGDGAIDVLLQDFEGFVLAREG